MLLKAGTGGGGGRDVIFRLVAQADPASKGIMAKWGADLAGVQKAVAKSARAEQKKAADNLAKEAKRAGDQETKEAFKRDKLIADNHLKQHLKAIDERQKAERKSTQDRIRTEQRAEEELARWKQRVRANSAQLEQRENIRMAREAAAERERLLQDTRSEYAKERKANSRGGANVAGGLSMAAGGFGNMARGIAFSGLVGEKNSEHVVNTLLGVEAAKGIGVGSMNAVKGVSTASGMAIGAGGAAAGGTAAVAALVAWLPALASAVKAATVYIKGSATTRRGDASGAIGEGIASTYSWALGGAKETAGRSQFFTDPRGGGETLLNPYLEAGRSSQALAGMQGAAETRRLAMARQAGLLGDLGEFQREQSKGNLSSSQSMLRGDAARFSQLGAGGENNSAVQAAYANVKASMEQVKQLSLDAARAQIEGSRDQLQNLRSAQQVAKQIADEAKNAYESDIAKASKLSPAEQLRLREIDQKQKSGQGLNAEELGFAEQFNEFRRRGFVQSEQQRRAQDFGLSDIFEGGKTAAEDSARKSTEIGEQVAKAELTVKQQHEVVIKLEGQGFADLAKEQIGDELYNQLKQFEEKTQKDFENKIRQAQSDFATARSPTR